LGLELPSSGAEFDGFCSGAGRSALRPAAAQAPADSAKAKATPSAELAAAGGVCHQGRLAEASELEPQCFVACGASCPAVQLAYEAADAGEHTKVHDVMCAHYHDWECFMLRRHHPMCHGFLQSASDILRTRLMRDLHAFKNLCQGDSSKHVDDEFLVFP